MVTPIPPPEAVETVVNITNSGGWETVSNWLINHLLLNISLIVNLGLLLIIMLNKFKFPIFDWTRYRASFQNKNGDFITIKKLKPTETIFEYDKGSYNVKHNHSSYLLHTFLFWRAKTFVYELGTPDPLFLRTNIKPNYDAQTYNAIHESDLIKQTNNWGKTSIIDILKNPKYFIGILVLVAIIIYILKGGTIT